MDAKGMYCLLSTLLQALAAINTCAILCGCIIHAQRRLRHEMSLQQCAWGSSDAALEVSRRCLTFGRLGGMPIPAPSAGKGPGPSQHSLSPDCSLVPSTHLHEKGYFSPSVKAPQSGVGSFVFHVVAGRRSPSVSTLG